MTALKMALTKSAPLSDLDEFILDLLPVAVYVCDTQGAIIRYNKQAIALWGAAPNLGESYAQFVGTHQQTKPDASSSEIHLAQVLRTGEPVQGLELREKQADGSWAWRLVDIAALREPDGIILGAIVCFRDITARKEEEQRIRQREQHLRTLLEVLPAALYTTDQAGRINFYNQAAAELWGYRPVLGEAEWCGSWCLRWPDGKPMAHDQCPMAVALKESRPVRGEAIAERPDGSRVPFAAYPTPLYDATGKLIGAVNMLVDISAHKQAEARQAQLINELNHRVKNTLATVQSIAIFSSRDSESQERFSDTFSARLMALSKAHDLLTRSHWEGASLRAVLLQEFAPYGSPSGTDHIQLLGADIDLEPRVALTLAMAFHELATNAAKYGALSCEGGRLDVCWTVGTEEETATRHLSLAWIEHEGPPVSPPTRRGFGSKLVERSITHELKGSVRFDFADSGLQCHIKIPLELPEQVEVEA